MSSRSLYVSSELLDVSNIRLAINSHEPPNSKGMDQRLDREQEVEEQWNTYYVLEQASETISLSLHS